MAETWQHCSFVNSDGTERSSCATGHHITWQITLNTSAVTSGIKVKACETHTSSSYQAGPKWPTADHFMTRRDRFLILLPEMIGLDHATVMTDGTKRERRRVKKDFNTKPVAKTGRMEMGHGVPFSDWHALICIKPTLSLVGIWRYGVILRLFKKKEKKECLLKRHLGFLWY